MPPKSPGDWDCLPHDPEAFFGLERGFDRKALKRAYGALIRQYKPETHPQQFQRIRQAYELLDSQIRYGVEQELAGQHQAAWGAVVQTARERAAAEVAPPGPSTVHVQRPEAAPRRSIVEQAIDDPAAVYERLAAQDRRSPQEFFLLAMLAEVVESGRKVGFLKWLLAGVKTHPRDPGLLALLGEHLRSDVSLEQAPFVLLAVASAVSSDVFYRITEPLWERMLRSQPFKTVLSTLDQCERRVRQIDARPRVVFYLRILRPALWKAGAKWVDQAFALVERHGTELDDAAEKELEFLLLVRQYIRKDRGRIGDDEVRKRLDAMIRGYCENESSAAAAIVAVIQDALARDSHGVIAAFPMTQTLESEGDADNRVLTLCLIIAGDIAEQTGLGFEQASESTSHAHSVATLNDLRESLLPVSNRIQWVKRRVFGAWFVGVAVLPPFLLLGTVSAAVFAAILVVWFSAATMAYWMLLKPRYLDARISKRVQAIVLRAYEDAWRPRLFRYAQACGHTGAAMQRLQQLAASQGDSEWIEVVLSYAQVDPGLMLFSRAQLFAT